MPLLCPEHDRGIVRKKPLTNLLNMCKEGTVKPPLADTSCKRESTAIFLWEASEYPQNQSPDYPKTQVCLLFSIVCYVPLFARWHSSRKRTLRRGPESVRLREVRLYLHTFSYLHILATTNFVCFCKVLEDSEYDYIHLVVCTFFWKSFQYF